MTLKGLFGVPHLRQRELLDGFASSRFESLDLDAVFTQLALDDFVQPVRREWHNVLGRKEST